MAREREEHLEDGEPPAFTSDTWVTVALVVLFAAFCVLAWLLVAKRAIPGAPGAPVGLWGWW